MVSAAAALPVCSIRYCRQTDSPTLARPHLWRTWHIAQVGRLLPQRTQSVHQSWWSRIGGSQLPLPSSSRQCARSPAVHYIHFASCQRHRTLQKRSPCPVRRRHSTIHHSQQWQGTRHYQQLFPVRPSLVGHQRSLSEIRQNQSDCHWYHC